MNDRVEAYLRILPLDPQAAFQALRAVIRSRLHDHLEVISYTKHGFCQSGLNGGMVAVYAGLERSCGCYPHSGTIIGQFAAETTGSGPRQGQFSSCPNSRLQPNWS